MCIRSAADSTAIFAFYIIIFVSEGCCDEVLCGGRDAVFGVPATASVTIRNKGRGPKPSTLEWALILLLLCFVFWIKCPIAFGTDWQPVLRVVNKTRVILVVEFFAVFTIPFHYVDSSWFKILLFVVSAIRRLFSLMT